MLDFAFKGAVLFAGMAAIVFLLFLMWAGNRGHKLGTDDPDQDW